MFSIEPWVINIAIAVSVLLALTCSIIFIQEWMWRKVKSRKKERAARRKKISIAHPELEQEVSPSKSGKIIRELSDKSIDSGRWAIGGRNLVVFYLVVPAIIFAVVYFISSSSSNKSSRIMRAERSCLEWIPRLEKLSNAYIYETQVKGEKVMVQISGRSARLSANPIYRCVFDSNTGRMVRLGAFDSQW